MIGATAKAEQFYGRAGSEATKGSRKGFSLLGGGECPSLVLTCQESHESKRRALKATLRAATIDAAAAKADMAANVGCGDPYFKAKRRRECAMELARLTMLELSKLKLVKTHSSDKRQHFIDICHETMTRAQFRLVMREAEDRAAKVLK